MRRYDLLILLTCATAIVMVCTAATSYNEKFVSIQGLMENNLIEVKFTSTGGHQEECVSLDLTNSTNKTQYIRLEPGRRLVSDDEMAQDILIVREELIVVKPKQTKSVKAYGFCCQSQNSGPGEGDGFAVGNMAPKSWQKLVNSFDLANAEASAMQHAIWALSDEHPVSGITGNSTNSQEIRRMVAEMRGEELPWYSTIYEPDTSAVFSGRVSHIQGDLNFYLYQHGIVDIQIRNQTDRIMLKMVDQQPMHKGKFSVGLDLKVSIWPKGDYKIQVFADGQLKKVQEFQI